MKWQLTMGIGVLAAALPLIAAEDAGKQWIRVSKSERVDFAPGGTIRITGSHGDLNVEGWDRPEVEITVTKSTNSLHTTKESDNARKRLDLIAVTMDRKSASELTIATAFPSRTLTRLCRGKSDVILEYRIHVPRNSNLVVHHDSGTVLMSDVTGDVQATARAGDIVLTIPAGGSYSIDARTRFGPVESDFGGAASGHKLVGRQLAFAPASPRHRIFLRAGLGGIYVKDLPQAGVGNATSARE